MHAQWAEIKLQALLEIFSNLFPIRNYRHATIYLQVLSNACMLGWGNGAAIPDFPRPRPQISGTGRGRGQDLEKFWGLFRGRG